MMSLKPPEEHLGHLVLRENKPIRLARIAVNGDRLQDSVILHPRYVRGGVDHEIFIARVYRRGRTLDLFLDEPIVVDGTEYGILNFKGVGADADRPLVIQPDAWWRKSGTWVPRKMGDPFGRVWGGLTKGKTRREYPARLFHEYGISHAPHLTLNEIPKEVTQYIKRSVHGSERHNLVQLVRGLQTNIRFDNYDLLTNEQIEQRIDITQIAKGDANLINTQFALARKGKMLAFMGNLSGNRFIDGRYTDAENLYTNELEWWKAVDFMHDVATHFTQMESRGHKWRYYKELERETGLPFLSMNESWCDSRKLLMRELDRVTDGKYRGQYNWEDL